jgi:rare lipoprotein A
MRKLKDTPSLWLIFFMLFNAACAPLNPSHDHDLNRGKHARYSQRDGAPKHSFPLFFQKLIPKFEPLSRSGNPRQYRVGKRTYHVMHSASGYHERGVASWYGQRFHAQRTSSGEPYNMYSMTAAHRTLPIPSYIRVKNLDNGKTAIVRVNDRGPFHSSRLIDLSYAAAKYLGVYPRGTAHVEIEAVGVPSR